MQIGKVVDIPNFSPKLSFALHYTLLQSVFKPFLLAASPKIV